MIEVTVTIAPVEPAMQVTIAPYAGNPVGVTLNPPQGCVLACTLP